MTASTDGVPSYRSYAKFAGPHIQELLDAETVPVPWVLRQERRVDFGTDDLAIDRVTSDEFQRSEMEKLWPRVWQFVCFEAELAQPGDHVLYSLGDWRFIIARGTDGEIRGFYNSCLHRGRLLRTDPGCVHEFRCPYHSFAWTLEGEFKGVPAAFAWDYEHVNGTEFQLPEVRVETWDGLVFMNMDVDASPLMEFLGDLPRHMERWPFRNRAIVAHASKVVRCNWKVGLDAFLETYHVQSIHPQTAGGTDGANCEYDVYPGQNFNRMIQPNGVGNPTLGTQPSVHEQMLNEIASVSVGPNAQDVEQLAAHMQVPEGMTVRQVMAMAERQRQTEMGFDPSHLTDSELVDTIEYYVFPNLFLWSGPIFYTFRPNGFDPHSCVMDVWMVGPWPESIERPAPAPRRMLQDDETFSLEEFGFLGPIIQQDVINIEAVQEGLRAAKKPTMTLGSYVDSRIRHYHALIDQYLQA